MADKARPNRLDETERLERRRKVARLYLARQPQQVIAQKLGVSQSTVSEDLRELRAEWKAESLDDIEEVILREAEELNEMERATALRFDTVKTVDWINSRLKIKERRSRLLGLDRPVKADFTTDGQALAHNWPEIRTLLLSTLAAFPEARVKVAEALTALAPEGADAD